MSMTYVDCIDTLKSASYKIDKRVREWNGEIINFDEYAQSVEFVTPSFQLVYSAKNLHNIKIPYSRKFECEKDMIKYGLFELFSEGPFSRETPYPMNGEINLKHTPTDLNYRHFELKIHDDKGKIVENLRSFQSAQMKPQRNGIDDLAQYIFEHILRKNLKFRS